MYNFSAVARDLCVRKKEALASVLLHEVADPSTCQGRGRPVPRLHTLVDVHMSVYIEPCVSVSADYLRLTCRELRANVSVSSLGLPSERQRQLSLL